MCYIPGVNIRQSLVQAATYSKGKDVRPCRSMVAACGWSPRNVVRLGLAPMVLTVAGRDRCDPWAHYAASVAI